MSKKIVSFSKKKTTKHQLFLKPFLVIRSFIGNLFKRFISRSRGFISRRPHRSFYLTPGSSSKRQLKIDSYFGFSVQVGKLLWSNKWLFAKFFLLYAFFSVIIVGLMSQENFAAFRDAISGMSSYDGISKWAALFSNAVTGGGGSTTDASQQILATMLFLYGWLTMVWLLRAIMRGDGSKIKLRDGIYSAGAPALSTLLVLLIIGLQLLPLAIVLIAYTSVTAAGWINTGVAIENMAALAALVLAGLLTLYWICSSIIALVIVTLPGTYPFVAIRAAGDLIVGRRLRLVYRLIYMVIPVILGWLVILMPAILIDSWLKLTWQPLVPLVVFILGILTTVWCASYVYLLYRKIVDDSTPPVVSYGGSASKKDNIKSKKQKKVLPRKAKP